MFFKSKKSKSIPTTVNPELGAELVPIDGMPDLSNAVATANDSGTCTKMLVSSAAPGTVLTEDANAGTQFSAFMIDGSIDGQPLAIVNDTEQSRFDVWTLDSAENPRLVSRIETQALSEEQDSWAAYFVINAACLPDGRVILTVNYLHGGSNVVLYLFDPKNRVYEFYSTVDKSVGTFNQYFEFRALSAKSAMLIYYTDRTRAKAEIYYNKYNHLVLFTPDHPGGVEVVKLGIDTGNVLDWAVLDQTLYLNTRDNRVSDQQESGYWSLNLSNIFEE